jgi:hypothetical protein
VTDGGTGAGLDGSVDVFLQPPAVKTRKRKAVERTNRVFFMIPLKEL